MKFILIKIALAMVFPFVFITLYFFEVSATAIFISIIAVNFLSVVVYVFSKRRNGVIYKMLSFRLKE